jgi:hypothetical protein
MHVDQVLRNVPKAERCTGHEDQGRDSRPGGRLRAAIRGAWLR